MTIIHTGYVLLVKNDRLYEIRGNCHGTACWQLMSQD